jgi:hypothetical protein
MIDRSIDCTCLGRVMRKLTNIYMSGYLTSRSCTNRLNRLMNAAVARLS